MPPALAFEVGKNISNQDSEGGTEHVGKATSHRPVHQGHVMTTKTITFRPSLTFDPQRF